MILINISIIIQKKEGGEGKLKYYAVKNKMYSNNKNY